MNYSGKNKFAVPLLLIVLIVWGVIIYEIINEFNIDESVIKLPEDNYLSRDSLVYNKKKVIELDTIQYVKFRRDPFVFLKSIKRKNKKPVKQLTQVQTNLEFKVGGVLINAKRRIVILEDLTNSKTIFMREGDSYKNLIIKKIEKGGIVLLINGITEKISILK